MRTGEIQEQGEQSLRKRRFQMCGVWREQCMLRQGCHWGVTEGVTGVSLGVPALSSTVREAVAVSGFWKKDP